MSTNFVQLNPSETNQEGDSAYAANSLTTGGIPTDAIVPSAWLNKVLFQASTMIAAIASFMVAQGESAEDSNLATLAANLERAIQIVNVGEFERFFTVISNEATTVDAATTALQIMMSCNPLPAGALNEANPGRAMRITLSGVLTPVNTSETVTLGLVLGGVMIASVSFVPAATVTHQFTLEFIVTTNSPGATGGLLAAILGQVTPASGAQPQLFFDNTLATSVDLTAALTFSFGVTFTTASGTNSCTENMIVQELVNA